MKELIESVAASIENAVWKLTINQRKKKRPFIFVNDPRVEFDYALFPDFVKNASKRFSVEHNDQWKLEMSSVTGEVRTTVASLESKFDPAQPTIIFNHPYGITGTQRELACKFFLREELSKANIFLVKAQAHDTGKEYITNSFDTLAHQEATIAGSVLMTNYLTEMCHKKNIPTVLLGVSMGGMVTAWHALLYEGSADLYFPLVSYPDVSAVFLGDGWEGSTDNRGERKELSPYSCAFVSDPNVLSPYNNKMFPILGTRDLLIGYKEAKKYWKESGCDTVDFNSGHFITAVRQAELKKLMLSQMKDMFKGQKRF